MLEFIVFNGPWKGVFVDFRGVVLREPYGNQAHLAFIACREKRIAWARISSLPIALEKVASRLTALNPTGAPARVSASSELRHALKSYLGEPWSLTDKGASPAGLLGRFNGNVRNNIVPCHTYSTDHDNPRHFVVNAWNTCLEQCPDVLLGVEDESHFGGRDRFPDSELWAALQRQQRTYPPLEEPPAGRAPYESEGLAGRPKYPLTVKEALCQWRLPVDIKADVKLVPWPALRKLIALRVTALEERLTSESARRLAAGVYAGLNWEQLQEALDVAEKYAVWYATAPALSNEALTSDREQSMREHPLIARMLGVADTLTNVHLSYSDWIQRYLRRHYPVRDIRHASADQLIFCAESITLLEKRQELAQDLREFCLQAVLGLTSEELEHVRAWRDNAEGRKPNSWGLQPEFERAAIKQLQQTMGAASAGWIRLDELAARLEGSEPWARSNSGYDGISPALVVQVAAAGDCRILMSNPEDVTRGEAPTVRGLVCAPSLARGMVLAGCDPRSVTAFPPGVKSAVESDTGPLPTANCVYLEPPSVSH